MQIALDPVNWRLWDACLTSNLSLRYVGIWRIILAQNQIIDFVDFISNTRSAWATAAQGPIAYQQYQYRQFYESVSSNQLTTTASPGTSTLGA